MNTDKHEEIKDFLHNSILFILKKEISKKLCLF